MISRKKLAFLTFLLVLFSGIGLYSNPEERYFDSAALDSKKIRLSICYPSMGSIYSLIELRKHGIIPDKNIIVIGIYHESERTDYDQSIKFIKEHKIKWFEFHKVSGNLNKENLYQKNPCTDVFRLIFNKSDGIIFFGGADIPPYIYKEKTNLLTQIRTPHRHYLELSFIFHLLGGFQNDSFESFLESHPDYPILGICLGSQSLNVGTGGTLIQDIWSEIYGKHYYEDVINLDQENWHSNPFSRVHPELKLTRFNIHQIRLNKKSIFCTELGLNPEDTPLIISSHHQMVDKPGKGFIITATSLDGKVSEAIEHKKYPNVLGTQFHPDFPVLWNQTEQIKITPDDSEKLTLREILENNPPSFSLQKKIWSWFMEQTKQYHKAK